MVKINITKITGTTGELLQHPPARRGFWQTWHSPISRFPRNVLWSLFAAVFLLQSLACWRIFFYEPALPAPSPYNVTETVALVTRWYELLQDMRYLGPDAIAYAPHSGKKAINITLAHELGLDQRVIDTLVELPYINSKVGGWMQPGHDILWRNGHFVDYRDDYDLWNSRDPLQRWWYSFSKEITFKDAVKELQALPKSAVPLSIIRPQGESGHTRYGLVIILDTASNRVVVLDTQGSANRNSDPFFKKFEWDALPKRYKIKGMFYGQEDLHGRLTPVFLKEFILETALLKDGFVPGSVRQDSTYTPELCPPRWEGWVKDLFRESGWLFDRQKLTEYLFPNPNNTVEIEILKDFNASPTFESKMQELQHNISVKYLPDRYCPVPRDAEFITKLESLGKLTSDQSAYAKSDEEIIPLNLQSWGGNLVFAQA